MKVKPLSKNDWSIEVTDEDKKKLVWLISKFKSKVELPPCDKWRKMTSEDIWKEILIQFSVRGSARLIGKLMDDRIRYNQFLGRLSLSTLLKVKSSRQEHIAKHLKEYKATRFYNKTANYINRYIESESIVRNGEIVVLNDLKQSQIDEDKMRDMLLKRLPFFSMKSISDFMIKIGASRKFIAFDTRVVGLLKKYFGLDIELTRIQSNMTLYKKIEEELNVVCRELGIELSWLDRVLFRFNDIIRCMFEIEEFNRTLS